MNMAGAFGTVMLLIGLLASPVQAADEPTPVLFRNVSVVTMTGSHIQRHRDVLVKAAH